MKRTNYDAMFFIHDIHSYIQTRLSTKSSVAWVISGEVALYGVQLAGHHRMYELLVPTEDTFYTIPQPWLSLNIGVIIEA